MTDVATLTIAEFLLARIAEDVDDLETSRISESPDWWMPTAWSRERGLAECEAKRKLLELHKTVESIYRCDMCSEGNDDLASFPCETLRVLAAVYAGHPDYRDEWKP